MGDFSSFVVTVEAHGRAFANMTPRPTPPHVNLTSMKRIFACGLLAAAAATGCATFKGATATVSPNPLEVHADSVRATIRATVPPKSGIAKGGTYTGRVAIRNNNDTLQKFQVGSVSVPYAKEIATEGASRSVTIAEPYREGMEPGTLIVENTYERKGKTTTLPNITLAQCCITTSRLLYTPGADANAANRGLDTNFFRRVAVSTQPGRTVYAEAKFNFPKDVYQIRTGEYKKADIVALGEFLKKGYNARQVRIQGFASPEGNFSRNEFLSIQRSRVVQRWLSDQLKKAGYQNYLDSSFFVLTTTSEDWEGFKANLDQTRYSEDVKRQIIEIINAGYDEDERERRIMGLVGGSARVEQILAPLRRATIVMEAAAAGRTPEQLNAIASSYLAGQTTADSLRRALSQDEFFQVIDRQTTPENKIRLQEEYTRAYADDYRGYNNLGVSYAASGNLDKAYEAFNNANTRRPNDASITSNLAAIQMARGNWDEAYRLAEAGYNMEKSPVTAFILGVRAHKRAQYAQASTYFEQGRELTGARYNAGLAKLLANDVAGAKNDLDAAIRANGQFSWAPYVQAIVGARSGDTNLMVTNLKAAVTADVKLAQKAQNDLEFRQYRDGAEFKAAIAR